MTATPTRRERQRQATFDEIVTTSRELLRAAEDVSIRAVAQEMGLTPPALYRYVDSHAELLRLVARSIFADVVAAMTVARDGHPAEDPAAQIVAASAAFRRWALTNREEFQLVFASPAGPAVTEPSTITSLDSCVADETGVHQFGAFFSEIFGRLWAKYRFRIPDDSELDPELLDVLKGQIKPPEVTDGFGRLTPGMIWMFERAWARLYGTVTLEVFGHIHPAFISTGALFASTMLDLGRELGIDDEWPRLQGLVRSEA